MRENFPTRSARWEGTRIRVSQLRLRLARKRICKGSRRTFAILLVIEYPFSNERCAVYISHKWILKHEILCSRWLLTFQTLGVLSLYRVSNWKASFSRYGLCAAWLSYLPLVYSLLQIISNSQLGAAYSILHFDLLFAVRAIAETTQLIGHFANSGPVGQRITYLFFFFLFFFFFSYIPHSSDLREDLCSWTTVGIVSFGNAQLRRSPV